MKQIPLFDGVSGRPRCRRGRPFGHTSSSKGVRRRWTLVKCPCGISFEAPDWLIAQHERLGSRYFHSRKCFYSHHNPGGRKPPKTVSSYINKNGYVVVYVPSRERHLIDSKTKRKALEHRLVMARLQGRPLLPSETVHHINGIRTDNRPENLELHGGAHGATVRYLCCDCGSHNVEPVGLRDRPNQPTLRTMPTKGVQ